MVGTSPAIGRSRRYCDIEPGFEPGKVPAAVSEQTDASTCNEIGRAVYGWHKAGLADADIVAMVNPW